jgi:hypothetical protein
MQKLKPRHCRDGDGPPDQDQEEPGGDTKGRRIQEENESEDKNVIKEDANHNVIPDEQQQEETQVQDKDEEDRGNKSKTPNRNTQKEKKQNLKTKKMRRIQNATI